MGRNDQLGLIQLVIFYAGYGEKGVPPAELLGIPGDPHVLAQCVEVPYFHRAYTWASEEEGSDTLPTS